MSIYYENICRTFDKVGWRLWEWGYLFVQAQVWIHFNGIPRPQTVFIYPSQQGCVVPIIPVHIPVLHGFWFLRQVEAEIILIPVQLFIENTFHKSIVLFPFIRIFGHYLVQRLQIRLNPDQWSHKKFHWAQFAHGTSVLFLP